ncbi:MAG: ABC transporter substrate-binding protein [Rhodobiaceae bacterium]|nr:ABC transporter substrate-binding protein [Rhodobiaceae bacterium]MCC0047907.1 ABC transporter substrate-binding protein [Rhodobiaceae bacterium]
MKNHLCDQSFTAKLLRVLCLTLPLVAGAGMALADAGEPSHGIAMHGAPKYQAGFSHFGYVNPDAPKGGSLTIGVLGSFDSVNPLIVKGVAARGVREHTLESLMGRSLDEPFSLYGLLAETIETDEERTYVEFTLNPDARFSDGEPVTAEDVLFTWELLKTKGRPNHRTYYGKVARAEKVGERGVRFTFTEDVDREIPLIMGLMPILPKHATDPDTFEQTTLDAMIGSGPYTIDAVDPGGAITFKRNPDYWARDLGVKRGYDNFDQIRYEYFRDNNTLFEAFKKGLYDARPEDDPTRWATGYDFPAVKDGRVVLQEFETGVPKGMSAFVFNTRRAPFNDIRVRQALVRLFDFEWINRSLYYDLYSRTQSYFEGSELSAIGRPASDAEKTLLAGWGDAVRDDVMDGTYTLPKTDGSGRDREGLRTALKLLEEAGFEAKNGVLVSKIDGTPFSFEILVASKEQERLALSYGRTLKRAGITVSVRLVDAAQYERRRIAYDYDMIQNFWFESLSPGNEQLFYWSGEAAKTEGTRNYPGIDNPAVDAMIAALLAARERPAFIDAVRALDRVLISGAYVVPLFHLPKQWMARKATLGVPEKTSLYGYVFETWWEKPQ